LPESPSRIQGLVHSHHPRMSPRVTRHRPMRWSSHRKVTSRCRCPSHLHFKMAAPRCVSPPWEWRRRSFTLMDDRRLPRLWLLGFVTSAIINLHLFRRLRSVRAHLEVLIDELSLSLLALQHSFAANTILTHISFDPRSTILCVDIYTVTPSMRISSWASIGHTKLVQRCLC
jgi:hypothetical protein